MVVVTILNATQHVYGSCNTHGLEETFCLDIFHFMQVF